MSDARQEHWNSIFTTKAGNAVSWFQAIPETSLRLIRTCGLPKDASILDAGAGASHLPDALLAEGFSNITVLDISAAALAKTRARLGDKGQTVRFIVADLAAWKPDLTVDLWHDRAVLHFLTEKRDRAAYADALRRAVRPGGFVVISGFAPSGPERCSGLPVLRADQNAIATLLGPDFDRLDAFEEDHQTPSGGRQRFVFTRFRRRGSQSL
ncbi:class I SAM-dependent methyltransferase [Microvirga sp. HBU67558]|uniref:class I SAM-dependent methyltransferase n=1 Tax=Microvirga TaxID=186650 RepID=UPI001B382929|nr:MULTISPECIES: class I SAM-dependent methyltransferase [unclassified Microvirga]MBQ0821916.1 class I SAM-dependent methyltransferase [Microvirga sp. HBU67558]